MSWKTKDGFFPFRYNFRRSVRNDDGPLQGEPVGKSYRAANGERCRGGVARNASRRHDRGTVIRQVVGP
jgi:hypothetical protein